VYIIDLNIAEEGECMLQMKAPILKTTFEETHQC